MANKNKLLWMGNIMNLMEKFQKHGKRKNRSDKQDKHQGDRLREEWVIWEQRLSFSKFITKCMTSSLPLQQISQSFWTSKPMSST